MALIERLVPLAIGLPAVSFAAMAIAWLLAVPLPERLVRRVTGAVFSTSAVLLFVVWAAMRFAGVTALSLHLGNWFEVAGYRFPVELLVDWISAPMLALTALLTGLVGIFSARYMHRDEGFLYFFLLMQLFGFGSLVLFAAGSFDLIVCGWELVGITSVLLIAYFHRRPDPVKNALRVFGIYRLCDLGLVTGVVLLHQSLESSALLEAGRLTGSAATLAGFLFLFAAMGKGAQVPFSGWLPRAVEGPTPSSAIFYGAISVHAGAYLLLRALPLLERSVWVQATVIGVGLLSACFGTMIGRACTDAKTSVAYASVTQLGLIFLEIGLGLPTLALWHICGHMVVRTFQFLRAPSAMHEFHQMHAAEGGALEPAGSEEDSLLSDKARAWLYRLALDRGHMDTILDRFVVEPTLALSRRMNPRSTPRVPGYAPRESPLRGSTAGEADA